MKVQLMIWLFVVFVSLITRDPPKYAILFSIGIPMCAMGIDYILGCIFEFDHMILVSDSCSHKKMDPYDLVWNVSKKEFISVGAIFICFGIAMFVVPFL